MTHIAVSLCDPGRADALALLVVDTASRASTQLSLGMDGASARGLAADESYLYCAFIHDRASHLALFRLGSLELVETIPLPFVRDIHSIALEGKRVLAASTGDDRVIAFDPHAAGHEVVWSASDADSDTHHLNALAWSGDRLLCSAFGPKFGATWGHAMDGYIYDVSSARYAVRGIYHPHSIASFGGELYFCESSLGKIRTATSEVRYVRGYARGLAIDRDGLLYAASSIARTRDASGFVIDNPADDGRIYGRCELALATPDGGIETISLAHAGREVYDLLVLA